MSVEAACQTLSPSAIDSFRWRSPAGGVVIFPEVPHLPGDLTSTSLPPSATTHAALCHQSPGQ
ncbi:MAG: hypothetical protein M0T79_10425, partial [Actinomycetota bacterium]|nr:hypothetical protein [Actinomycetota bacterium]